MKLQILILLASGCVLSSCYGVTKSKTSELLYEESSSINPLQEEEDFYAFLNKFSREDIFQLSRIRFPLPAIVPDYDDEDRAPKEEFIYKHEWETLDLSYDSTFATRPFDRYEQAVYFFNDTALVEVRGINNGIYGDYYFAMLDRRWFLVKLLEQ